MRMMPFPNLPQKIKTFQIDEIHLEPDNVLATLYAAKKYIVPHLARVCVKYLETSLSAKNACLLLSQSRNSYLILFYCVTNVNVGGEHILYPPRARCFWIKKPISSFTGFCIGPVTLANFYLYKIPKSTHPLHCSY